MNKWILIVLVVVVVSVVLALNLILTGLQPAKPSRLGLFVYMYKFLKRPEPQDWDTLLTKMSEANFTSIIPFVIDARGYAYFYSEIAPVNSDYMNLYREKYGDVDPLKDLINRAHSKGFKVWAWVSTTRVSREFLEKHRDWAVVDSQGVSCLEKPVGPYKWYYISIANKEAREYIISILKELVEKYEIDGIVLEDDLGFPSRGEYDFSYAARKWFEEEYNITVNWPSDVLEGGKYRNLWLEWRIKVVTSFVEEAYKEVKKIRKIPFGAAVSVNVDWQRTQMGVDWREWVKKGVVDFVAPMLYHRDRGQDVYWIQFVTKDVITLVKSLNEKVEVYPIIGGSLANTRDMPPSEWVEAIKFAVKGGGKTVLVFAGVCVEEAKAWKTLKEFTGS